MNGKDLLFAIADTDTDFINESARFDTVKNAVIRERKKKIAGFTACGVFFAICLSAVGISGFNSKHHGKIETAQSDVAVRTNSTDTITESDITDTEKEMPVSSKDSGCDEGIHFPCEKIEDLPDISKSEWADRTDVIWGTEEKKGVGSENISPGTKKISDELYSLMDKRPQDTVFAVMVDFSSSIIKTEMENWNYNGKTVASLQKELDALNRPENAKSYIMTDASGNQTVGYIPSYEDTAKAKELIKQQNEIRDAFIKEKCALFKADFNSQNLEIFVFSERDTTDNKVFYTFATKGQLENFSCKNYEAFLFCPAYKLK